MAHQLAELTWNEAEALPRDRTVVILPIGAIEAHGPHLPLNTDVVISEAMAHAAGARFDEIGWETLITPSIQFSPAQFARDFAGTVHLAPEAMVATVRAVIESLSNASFRWFAVANSHLDPANLGALKEAVEGAAVPVAFPDITRKPWALRLTDEFRSGACHAGQYESSIVMARRPDLVQEDLRKGLPENPQSLSTAIRAGQTSFEEAGGPQAYFGAPAAATAEEGEKTIRLLGDMLFEAIQALAKET